MRALALAAAYVAVGRLSLLLAIPPGFAAPVWPAAGLALAAILLWGDGMCLGVFLGHFLVNLTMGGADKTSVALAAVIAAGGTAQAFLAARLLRRYPGFPNPLSRPKDIVAFMGIAGPAACVVSPTVGTLALLFTDRISPPEALFSWGTWWVGDALGVLILAPAALLWALPRPAGKSNRALLVTIPLACTLAAAVGIFVFARSHETRRIQQGFEVDATAFHHVLEKETDVYVESLRSLRYFFNSSKEVDRGEFRTFTERPLARHPGFLALSWNVLAPGGGVVVRYIEPEAANRAALGRDVASTPERRAVFEKARDSGEPVASGKLTLIQTVPGRPQEHEQGFLVAVPIYALGPRPGTVAERRARLRGYTVAVLDLDRLVESALRRQTRPGLLMRVFDEDDPVRPAIFGAPPAGAVSLRTRLPFEIPGRAWTVEYTLSAEEYARRRSPTPWLALMSVLAFSLVLTVFLLLVTGHADAVEAEVAQRTAELESQKALLRSIIDNMGEGVAVANKEGRFIVFNAAAERIVGVGAVEAGPGEWSDRYGVFQPDAITPLPPEQNPLARALRGEPTDDCELFIRNPLVPEGVYIIVTSRPLKTPDGAPNGGVAVFRDITARRRTADELRRAKAAAEAAGEAKAAFLANMSHEIRTPMNAVIGMAAILQATSLNEEQKDYIRTLRSAADGLLTIVNDILDFSRFEAGKVPLEERDFDFRAAVHDALRILEPQASPKNLDLAFFCDPSVPTQVRGDGNRLRQVLLNLIGNAVKFTAEGGVSVEARRWGSGDGPVGVRFTVRDTGIGIPPEVQNSLFTPFVQAEASTTRRFGGTGLGLAISKKIVEAMGGRIELKSRPGEGAEFSFNVVLKPASGEAAPAAARTWPRDLKVLFVDDNHVNRLILSQQLASWEMEAWAASDAADCWAQLKEAKASDRPFSLAIIDLRMPDEDGLSLARRVKADPDLRTTPLILCTSASTSEPLPDFAARVQKPVNPSALFDAIASALGAPAAAPQDPAAERPPERTYEHLRVLLVDDNATNIKVGQLQLRRLGVVPDTASNGHEALVALSRARYDVVFLDCQMPVMDGFQAARELRRLEGAARRTPLVAMTANALEGDREACLKEGMDDYLAKPVSLENLAAALARWDDPLDPNVLRDLRALADGADDVLKDILGQFRADAPAAARAIREAATGDPAKVGAAAHKLRGSSGTVGARRVAWLAGLLEDGARKGDLAEAPALAARLEAAVAEAVRAAERATARA